MKQKSQLQINEELITELEKESESPTRLKLNLDNFVGTILSIGVGMTMLETFAKNIKDQ